MGKGPSSGSGERITAKKDRAETVSSCNIPALERRIIRLKEKYPAWGARRIKHQFDLPCSWRTVHRILKKHGLLIRVKAKPQPAGKRFQRQHVDSMWQGDTFQFRIRGVGKVYVTGFTDDCSRYRVKSKVTFTKMLPQQSTLSTGHSAQDESRVKFISIMENSSSPKFSKLKHRNTASN